MGGRIDSSSSVFPVVVFAHLLAIAIAILVLVWVFEFRKGLAFGSQIKAKIFNVHPLLMVVGFILLAGEAPRHSFFGLVIFFLATLTAEIGIAEKFIFLGLRRSQEALIVNFTGLLIFIFAVTVGCGIILSPRK